MIMYPTALLLFSFCCDAPFKILFAYQQLAWLPIAIGITQSEAKDRTLVRPVTLMSKIERPN